LSSHGHQYIRADRQRLKQVLLNLLSNAIKFNRSNGHVVLGCHEATNRRVRIEVADTGFGISQEGLNKIFTPFERLDADRKALSGTGLGLALCKRMVEAMEGTIGVQSTEGVGSRFFIELPLADRPMSLNAKAESPHAPFRRDTSYRGTVLYIEDNVA